MTKTNFENVDDNKLMEGFYETLVENTDDFISLGYIKDNDIQNISNLEFNDMLNKLLRDDKEVLREIKRKSNNMSKACVMATAKVEEKAFIKEKLVNCLYSKIKDNSTKKNLESKLSVTKIEEQEEQS